MSRDGWPVISSFGSRCARRFGARCRESRRPRPGWRRAVRAVVRAPARPARYGEFCDTPPRASARATGGATKNTAYADRTDADNAALVEAVHDQRIAVRAAA